MTSHQTVDDVTAGVAASASDATVALRAPSRAAGDISESPAAWSSESFRVSSAGPNYSPGGEGTEGVREGERGERLRPTGYALLGRHLELDER